MVDDVAEKVGTCQSPAAARAVRADEKRALARSDEQRDRSRSGTRGSIRGFGLRHREDLLDFQSFDPALVQLRGDRVERMHALVEPLEHLLRGLHRRPGLRDELLFPILAPGADQLARHLDMALHAEVLAEHERLVRTIRTPGDPRGFRRDGESLAVPVKAAELPRRAFAMSCPPRQWPSTGTSASTASFTSPSTAGIHGRSSFTLIGPPMNASPENARGSEGTSSPASILTSLCGMRCPSRNVAK